MFRLITILTLGLLLNGCVTDVWTGVSLIYDRHNIYIKLNDFQLSADVSRALYHDKLLKCDECSIDMAVFNLDVLMVGHLPTEELYQEADARVRQIPGKRRFFNKIRVSHHHEQTDHLMDSWITGDIRSSILADSSIDPHQFKIVTSDQVVYVMGDVIPVQARQVIHYARQCRNVKLVVNLLKYYNLSNKPSE